MIPIETNIESASSPVLKSRLRKQPRIYFAYGLQIQSELPLPEFDGLSAPSSRVDVSIKFGRDEGWMSAVREQSSSWHVDPKEARFWFKGVGGFRVSSACEIVISPERGVDNALLRMYVEGMMMATLLYQRGHFVLHASVVHIGGSAAAVLGQVGAGKSSTAAALHARGHAVVTDDNAAISFAPEAPMPMVTPAFPYVKVFPAIAAALGYPVESLKRMHPSQPKFVSSVAGDFPVSEVPLARIYVLTRNAEQAILPLSRAQTIIELVRNSVPTRWKLAGGANHLQSCASLAGRIPAFQIRTFNDLNELPRLAERIELHHTGAPDA